MIDKKSLLKYVGSFVSISLSGDKPVSGILTEVNDNSILVVNDRFGENLISIDAIVKIRVGEKLTRDD